MSNLMSKTFIASALLVLSMFPIPAKAQQPDLGQGANGGSSKDPSYNQMPQMLMHQIPSISQPDAQGKVTHLTLDESIATAIATATAVQKAKNDVELTGTQLIQGYAQFLPNLVGIGNYSQVQGKQYLTSAVPTYIDTRNHGAAYQLSTDLNIFNGLSDFASLKSALNRRKSSDLSLYRAKQQIALDVSQGYLQVILDQQIVKIAEKNLAASQGREQLFTEQARVGIRNLADLYRQQAQTSSDESFLASSQDKLRNDELQLIRRLRLDTSSQYDFAEPQMDAKATADAKFENEKNLIDIAVTSRPDLQSEQHVVEAYQWDARAAKGSYFPKLDFGFSVNGGGRILDSQLVNGADVTNQQGQSFADQMGTEIFYTAGLTLTWNIFDRWLTKVNVERANVVAKNSNLDLEDLKNQVVAEVRQAFGDYRTVLQQLESSNKGLLAAQKAFETVEARYKLGSASFIDLVTAQATLVQAQAAQSQALISFQLQQRILDTVLGTAKTGD